MPECELRKANGTPGIACDQEACVFWRLVEQLDVDVEPAPTRCAIQYFRLLDGGAEIAAWLGSVKLRVEECDPPAS